MTYHVQVEESDSEAEVVLVEHSLELMVQESSTLREPNTSPRIECSTLELCKLALLLVLPKVYDIPQLESRGWRHFGSSV